MPIQSTYERILAEEQAKQSPANSIANIYQAYKSGQMTPEQKSEFEHDVKTGAVMLPQGAALDGEHVFGSTEKPAPVMLPVSVTEAYVYGKMTEQQRNDLEHDIKAGVVQLPPLPNSPLEAPNTAQQGVIEQPKEPSLGEKLKGVGEAGLATATGMTGGVAGMIGGTVKTIGQSLLDGTYGTPEAADLVEQSAAKEAQSLTYAPRTQTGQQYAQNVGDVMSTLNPVMGAPAEMAQLGASVRAGMPAINAVRNIATAPIARAAEAVQPAVVNAAQAIKNAPLKAMEIIGAREPTTAQATSQGMSAGAMATDPAAMRQAAAQELPVPVDLTKGQATRDFGQLRFEQESAKNPELGAPIRERMATQNQAIQQSFDAWLDETGAQAPDSRAAGITIDNALRAKAARDKTEIRTAYKDAEKSGETAQPVTTKPVVDAINQSVSAESTAPVLVAAKKELIRLGGAIEDESGQLIPRDMSLANTEQLRKFVNKTTGADPTNIKFAGDLKRAIDASTEGAGGALYKKARELRAKYARQYEDHAVISDLLNNKRGTADRKVALEDVADRVLYRGSLDDMRHARKILQNGGDLGKQAWKEIQGSAIRDIHEAATKNVARDVNGNAIISPAALDKAIRRLDSEGKLDYLFGRKGSDQLRAVNDLAKVMFTTPPGAVNTSNTASVLLAALDMAVSGTAGMPLPVMSGLRMMIKNVKDRKLKARIKDALEYNQHKG